MGSGTSYSGIQDEVLTHEDTSNRRYLQQFLHWLHKNNFGHGNYRWVSNAVDIRGVHGHKAIWLTPWTGSNTRGRAWISTTRCIRTRR